MKFKGSIMIGELNSLEDNVLKRKIFSPIIKPNNIPPLKKINEIDEKKLFDFPINFFE